jgi:hypothetical protein
MEGSVTNHKNSDIKEAVTSRTEAIQQERFETQNIIIVRYYHITRLEHLYNAAEREDKEDRLAEVEGKANGLLGDGTSQLALEAPLDHSQSCALTRLPVFSLGQLDQSLHQIRHSPKEMLQASDRAIDPLLERWTNLDEARQRNGNRDSAGSARYVPSVHDLPEEDEDRLRKKDFHDREESPQGYLLEGLTTDWRQPQSAAAKREASLLRKQYTGYQPSIDVEEAEEEEGVRVPSSRVTHRYAVDSSSESSESEIEEKPRRRRKSSGSPTTEKKKRFSDGPPFAHTYGPAQSSFGGRYTVSPNPTPGSTPRSSISAPRSPGEHRPAPTTIQNPMHHSMSSPLPPIHTPNTPNPYAPYNPYSPTGAPLYQGSREQMYPGNRYMPPQQQRLPLPTRPVSQDGKARSPSRLSTHGSSSRSRPMTTKEIAAEKVKQDRMLAKSATKGILGASGIAMFLEALEGL